MNRAFKTNNMKDYLYRIFNFSDYSISGDSMKFIYDHCDLKRQ